MLQGVDMGAIVSASQLKTITEYVQGAKLEGADVFQPNIPIPENGFFYPPTLITNVQTVSKCVSEEVKIYLNIKSKMFFNRIINVYLIHIVLEIILCKNVHRCYKSSVVLFNQDVKKWERKIKFFSEHKT